MYKRMPMHSPAKKALKVFSRTGLVTPTNLLVSLIFWTVLVLVIYYSYSWYKLHAPSIEKLHEMQQKGEENNSVKQQGFTTKVPQGHGENAKSRKSERSGHRFEHEPDGKEPEWDGQK